MKRRKYGKLEERKRKLKYIKNNLELNYNIRLKAQEEESNLPKSTSISNIKNYCIITKRKGNINKKYKISRIKIRELALMGELKGIEKK